jgi:hypothetical protein
MNSTIFFEKHRKEWDKSGIYVIEQPLFKYNGRPMYKVGYASTFLSNRLSD